VESSHDNDVLAPLISDERFWPSPPSTLEETGLAGSMIESLICKHLAIVGTSSGRGIAKHVCLPFGVLEELFDELRSRQIIVHRGAAPLNDYRYSLTEQGRQRADTYAAACAYAGPAPVPLMDYVLAMEAQSIRAEASREDVLAEAFADISVKPDLFEDLGPAVNSGAGLFLYGAPGNGKSTLAKRITRCFGQEIWIPHAVIEDNQIVKVFDAAYHQVPEMDEAESLAAPDSDRRWVKVRRPTVIVGGELTMDALEIRYDPTSHISEAPLQMKSNGGCLLIDDFGRQRIEPTELLNRWIVPLESRVDFLTLSTGKKIQIPFEQLIIFSTNLEPSDLVDEAFLRRIPYKIEVGDADEAEFHRLFEIYAEVFGCACRPDVVDYVIQEHYRPHGRPMRRCHPRDLLTQIRNYCVYHGLPTEMRPEYFDRVVGSYFTIVRGVAPPAASVQQDLGPKAEGRGPRAEYRQPAAAPSAPSALPPRGTQCEPSAAPLPADDGTCHTMPIPSPGP
jgi:hypothetical protein